MSHQSLLSFFMLAADELFWPLDGFFPWKLFFMAHLVSIRWCFAILFYYRRSLFLKMIKKPDVAKSCWIPAIIPCLMQVVGLVFIPESPRWLVSSFCEFFAASCSDDIFPYWGSKSILRVCYIGIDWQGNRVWRCFATA